MCRSITIMSLKATSLLNNLCVLLCLLTPQTATFSTKITTRGDVTTASVVSTACPVQESSTSSVYGNSTDVPPTVTRVTHSDCNTVRATTPPFSYPSFSLYSWTELVSSSTVLAIFSAFGAVGNTVSIYVYFPRGKQSNLYVFYLSVIDFIMCAMIIPFLIAFQFYTFSMPFVLTILFAIGLVLIILQSLEILVSISIDRFVACTYPQMYRKMQRYAKFIIAGQVVVNSGFLALGLVSSNVFGIICQMIITGAFFIMVIMYVAIFIVLRQRMSKTLPMEHTMHSTQHETQQGGTLAPRTEVAETVIDPEDPEADGVSKPVTSLKEPIDEPQKKSKQSKGHTTSEKTTGGGKSKHQVSSRTRNLVVTIRMFFAITFAFVVAYLPYYLVTYKLVAMPRTFTYSLFLNHVANPIIYFALNKTYRDRSRKLFSIIMPCCCTPPSTIT